MTTTPSYTIFFAEAANIMPGRGLSPSWESGNTMWSIQIDDIELLAGMLAAGAGIMDDLNNETNFNIERSFIPPVGAPISLVNRQDEHKHVQYYLDSEADVSTFRLVNGITEDLINENTYGKRPLGSSTGDSKAISGKIEPGCYGLWMHSGKRFHYSLYTFRKASFFQGIISICNTFQVDFRNYIYGLPFDIDGNQYALGGYVMTPYQFGYDAPDLDDIEDEEADDENIIEPLKKDY